MASFFSWRFGRSLRSSLAVALAMVPAVLLAGDQPARLMTRSGPNDPNATTIDMFDGIANGDIAVKFIPKDSTQARVLIENKTDKPLSVKLPAAFAGVPVLAAVAPQGGAQGGGQQGQQTPQPAGGGMGGMGMPGMGGGGGMFNLPPEKIGQLKVATVCLEHGKTEPRPAIPYEIKPIESVTANPETQEICRMLGTGQINQRAAQVAVWHYNNNISWQDLAAKQLRHADGTSQPYFSPLEIRAGMQLGAVATRMAEQRKQQQATPSSSTPTSSQN
jgi:hypothetical protein